MCQLNYDYAINLSDPSSQATKLYDLIPNGTKVLDVGCATGQLGSKLRTRKGCFVVGIEMNEEFAAKARVNIDRVIVGDIENKDTISRIGSSFDVIILADILEHLLEPRTVLKEVKTLFNPKGFVVVSLPNIAYWEIRKQLLFGKFQYKDTGILDRTHLRFFTINSAIELFEESGYTIEQTEYSCWHLPFERMFRAHRIPILNKLIPRARNRLTHIFPGLFSSQLIFKARPQI